VRIARFTTGSDPKFAVLEGEPGGEMLSVMVGDPLYVGVQFTGERVPLAEARLLAPVIPRSKVLCIGRNYAEHAAEMGHELPVEPLVFLKPNTSVIGPGDPIRIPVDAGTVHYEGELAVVIGRICRDVPAAKASDVIFGYTCANDVSARDWQKSDGQWWRAKGSDTFCPLGPVIATGLDPSDLVLRTRRDGELVQDGRTSQMIRSVPELVAFVSSAMTLLPGDILLTGTPAGVGPIAPGQSIEVEIEGIGTLTNPVRAS
jgi:2-keto-4-pentenoate hydratase/2-oxohepta-3-ene-1,7-dioic acid hydratase in catechol pathway